MSSPTLSRDFIFRTIDMDAPAKVASVPAHRPRARSYLFSIALTLVFLAMAFAPAFVPPTPTRHLYASAGGPVDTQALTDIAKNVGNLSIAGILGLLAVIIQGLVKLASVFQKARDDAKQVRDDAKDVVIKSLSSDVKSLRDELDRRLESERLATIRGQNAIIARVDRKLEAALVDTNQGKVDERAITDAASAIMQGQVDQNTANIAAKP